MILVKTDRISCKIKEFAKNLKNLTIKMFWRFRRRWRQIETCARVFDCESLGNWHHIKVRLKMAEKLGFFETGSLVDVGCGRGRYLAYFIERYGIPFCVGLDISMKAIRDAKELLKGQSCVDFVVADAENLPFKDSSFDFVFSTDVVEHLHNPSKRCKRNG